jgi:hypothetical protein
LPNELKAEIAALLDVHGICAFRLASKNLHANSQKAFDTCFGRVAVYMSKASLRRLLHLSTLPQTADLVKVLVLYDWRLCCSSIIYNCLHDALINFTNCTRVVVQSRLGQKFTRTECRIEVGRHAFESLHRMLWPRRLKDRACILPRVIAATKGTSIEQVQYASPKLWRSCQCKTNCISAKSVRHMLHLVPPGRFELSKLSISLEHETSKAVGGLAALVLTLPHLTDLALRLNRSLKPRMVDPVPFRLNAVLCAIQCPSLERLLLYVLLT